MAGDRAPNPRQLDALRSVAEAGGVTENVSDPGACEECLVWGWLVPEAGRGGFRLTAEGWAALKGWTPPAKSKENRAHPRREVIRRGVIIHQPTGRSFSCTVLDLSIGGARLQLYAPDLPKEGLTLVDREMGTAHKLRIAWSAGPFVGVAFTSTTPLPGT